MHIREMAEGLVGIGLLGNAWIDIRKKEISLLLTALIGLALLVCLPFRSDIRPVEALLGIAVGLGVMGISKATRGQIGMGDGILFCMTGAGIGVWSNVELLILSLFLSSFTSIVFLVLRRLTLKESVPFVPFLGLGYCLLLFLG